MASSPAVSSTLDVLHSYIAAQEALLARTIADINRIRNLRNDTLKINVDPTANLDSLLNDVVDPLECEPCLPSKINWSIFDGLDPTSLYTIPLHRPSKPALYQQSPLSELQKFVRRSKIKILDPILGHAFTRHDQQPRTTTSHRNKRRRTDRGSVSPSLSNSPTRGLSPNIPNASNTTQAVAPRASKTAQTRLYRSSGGVAVVQSIEDMMPSKGRHERIKSEENDTDFSMIPAKRPARAVSPYTGASTEDIKPFIAPAYDKRLKNKKEKPRPETYKLPWSEDEQRHLERLLEEYGPQERNRWLKISQAMHGRRTPRQVASRVQKFFEKLREKGVEPDDYTTGRVKEEFA